MPALSKASVLALLVLVLVTIPCVTSARLATAQGREAYKATFLTSFEAEEPATARRQLLPYKVNSSDCTTCVELSDQLQLVGQKWHVRCHLDIIGHDMGLPLDAANQQVDNIVACAELCSNHSCGRGEPDCCQGFTFVISESNLWPEMGCFLKTGISWGALASTNMNAPAKRNAKGVMCVNKVSALSEGATGCDADPVCRATKQSSQNAFTISMVSLVVSVFAALSSTTMKDIVVACWKKWCGQSAEDAAGGKGGPSATAAYKKSSHGATGAHSGGVLSNADRRAGRGGDVDPADQADALRAQPEVRDVLPMTKAATAQKAGPARGEKDTSMCDSRATVDVETGADVGTD